MIKKFSYLHKQQTNEDCSNNYTQNTHTLLTHLEYLQSLLDLANSISGSIGIFGTSIAGTWLAESVQDKVTFFVDEDPNRIGRHHLHKPIVSPDELASGAKVLVPLPPEIAIKVANRLSHLNCEFLVPASLNA